MEPGRGFVRAGTRPPPTTRRSGAVAAGRLTGPPMAPVAAAVLPHPPLLVPELAGAAAPELAPLRPPPHLTDLPRSLPVPPHPLKARDPPPARLFAATVPRSPGPLAAA